MITALALRIGDFQWVLCGIFSELEMFGGLFVPLEMPFPLIWFPRDAFILLVHHIMVLFTFGARWMRAGDA
jgi:hypothetical protein